jgi:AraC-like DNA-binding protein
MHGGDSAPSLLSHRFALLAERWPNTAAARLPLLVWMDTVGGPEPQPANHHRDFCSLYVVRRGRGTHIIDDVPYAIARGDVYAMGPGMRHHFAGCEKLLTDTFHFTPGLFERETREALAAMQGFHALFVSESAPLSIRAERRWLHLTPTQYAAAGAAMAELRAEWTAGVDAVGAALTRGLFLRLLVLLSRFQTENRTSPSAAGDSSIPLSTYAGAHEATIAAAVRCMEERFAEPLRIEQIAALVFLSPDRFTEVFAQAMGRTPRDYLRHIRLEHAKMLLTTTDQSIASIAEASGFPEPAYFTRVMRAATGMPPSAYRRGKGG